MSAQPGPTNANMPGPFGSSGTQGEKGSDRLNDDLSLRVTNGSKNSPHHAVRTCAARQARGSDQGRARERGWKEPNLAWPLPTQWKPAWQWQPNAPTQPLCGTSGRESQPYAGPFACGRGRC